LAERSRKISSVCGLKFIETFTRPLPLFAAARLASIPGLSTDARRWQFGGRRFAFPPYGWLFQAWGIGLGWNGVSAVLMIRTETCPVCGGSPATAYREVDGIAYFRCSPCGSLFADPAFMAGIERGEVVNYQSAYWESEISAARSRSFGAGLMRAAEVIRMCRIPIRRFIDIGSGTGSLLDAAGALLPEIADRFYGIELFPPAPDLRSTHPNYRVGALGEMPETFDAGVCIEVIEHLSPATLRALVAQLAGRASPGALFLFNSAQPSFVETHDPAYLDPLGRGHIVSYSVEGVRHIFEPEGFNVIALPGRDWAFLAEFSQTPAQLGIDELFTWLWTPHPENMAMLETARFGPLMIGMGLDSARVYLEHANAARRQECSFLKKRTKKLLHRCRGLFSSI
jgi:ribosomal protein L37AE/L43A